MRVFLKTIDERVWMTVVQGWTHPTEIVEEKTVPTPQDEWTEDELKSSGWNSKGLNAIYNALTPDECRAPKHRQKLEAYSGL